MTATMQDPGRCNCPGPGGCSTTINGRATSCAGGAPGITAEAHDATSGGTLLGTATTDASGNYSIAVAGAIAGNAIVVVLKHTRLNTATRTLSYTPFALPASTQWTCGVATPTATTAMTAAAGYHCSTLCALPLKDTLHLTDSVYGTDTLTWLVGTTWASAGKSVSFGGSVAPCTVCPAATTTIQYLMDTNISVANTFVGSCPDAAGGSVAAGPGGGTSSSLTCPPSFSFSLTISSWTLAAIDTLYSCGPVTITITE